MRAIGVILGIALAAAVIYGLLLGGAPERTASLDERVRAAVDAVATHPVEIDIQGGRPVLRGYVEDSSERAALLAAVAGVEGVGVPVDRLEILPLADPYQFSAAYEPDDALRLAGVAPNQTARAQIAEAARAAALRLAGARDGGQTVEVAVIDEMTLAAGAPDGWADRAVDGLAALALLRRGAFELNGADGRLSGVAPDEAALDAARSRARSEDWETALSLARPVADPYTLTVLGPGAEPTPEEAEKLSRLSARLGAGGGAPALAGPESWRVFGHAPDAQARERIVDSLQALTETRPVAAIVLADGAPDAAWVDFVVSALGSLPLAEAPRLTIAGAEAQLSGLVETPEAAEALIAAFQLETPEGYDGVSLDLAPRDPRRAATASIIPDDQDGVRLEGRLPERFVPSAEAWAVFDGLSAAPRNGRGDAALWTQTLDSLAAVVSRVGPFPAQMLDVDGRLRLVAPDQRVANAAAAGLAEAGVADQVELVVDPDVARLGQEPAAGAEASAALAAAASGPATGSLSGASARDLDAPPAPEPGLSITLSADDGLRIEGVLPEGLDRETALEALGVAQAGGELSSGGRGDAEAWRRDLTALGELLGEFEELDAAIGPGGARFEGRTLERSDASQVRALLSAGFADQSPNIDVAPTAVAYPEGAERRNPVTGRRETRRQGYWLPEVEVDADADGCRLAADLVLLNNEIRFRFDSTALDVRARSVINELSAIALECLPDAAPLAAPPALSRPNTGPIIALEIGGHTDSFGPELYNKGLSQRRADAVRRALIARGMADARLIARGFGETAPLVENDSRANRRRNRRITFEWIREPSPQ